MKKRTTKTAALISEIQKVTGKSRIAIHVMASRYVETGLTKNHEEALAYILTLVKGA